MSTLPTTDINGRPYNPDLSPFYPCDLYANSIQLPIQRVVPPEEGRFILPANADRREGDRCYCTTLTHQWCRDWPNQRTVIKDAYWRHGCDPIGPYSRAIQDDPTLFAAMQEYASGGSVKTAVSLDTQLTNARAEVRRLEREVKARDEIKVGDWVECVDVRGCSSVSGTPLRLGRIGRVTRVNGGYVSAVGMDGGWHDARFRKLTPTEVTAHLAAEEAKKAEAKRVAVTVEGKEYLAIYKPGYVEFGCAKISNVTVRNAHLYMEGSATFGTNAGNRSVEAIRIGKGEFTREMLAKMVTQLVD